MASSALSDEVAAKVRQQVEFYFSDSNLPNDKFLLRAVQQTEEGYVSLAVVSSFMKMKNHLGLPPDTTPDTISPGIVAAVGEALRSSPALKVSEDGSQVARSRKLAKPEEARTDLYARSIAVSPFPYNVTREEIEKFFEEHSKPYSVRLPRHHGSNSFCGHAVIELSSPEEVRRVSELSISFKGAELKFQSRESFEKDFHSRKPVRSEEPFYTKGLVVRFKLESPGRKAGESSGTKPDEEMKEAEPKKGEPEPAAEKKEDEPEGPAAGAEQPAEKEAEASKPEVISREQLKAAFEQYGVVKFVDYCKGDTSGFVRFETPQEANKARTAAVVAEAGGLAVKNWVVVLEAVQGKDESAYWKNAHQAMIKHKERKEANNWFKGAEGNSRFDKRNNLKRSKKQQQQGGKHVRLDKDDDNEDEPEAKLQRTA